MAVQLRTILLLSVALIVCFILLVHLNHNTSRIFLQPIANESSIPSRLRSNETNQKLFDTKKFVIWSNDFHISPINDLKQLLQPLGVQFIDKSLSGHCHVTNTCEGKKTLRIINRNNAYHLNPSLIPQFFESYRNDPELLSVDAFACFLPPATCELFEPFNRSLLIIVPTRYEAGRLGQDRWTKWNKNLIRYSRDSRHIIAANNLYDAEYVRYFTGIRPQLLPSYCGYLTEKYSPTRPGFILAPIHNGGFGNLFNKMYAESCLRVNCTVELFHLRSRYSHYKYSDIASHQGIVYVPYQVSVMSMFEQYRMNIPLFFPSLELLASWQHQYMVMNERTWDGVAGKRPARSAIAAAPTQNHLPDPNDEQHYDSIRYWIQFSDFYQMPHIKYFNSTDDLARILQTVTPGELKKTSEQMQGYNLESKAKLLHTWTGILRKIAKYSPNNPR